MYHLDDFHNEVEGGGPPLVQLREVVLEQPPDLGGVLRLHLLLLRPDINVIKLFKVVIDEGS
jgi:hypothetical protein